MSRASDIRILQMLYKDNPTITEIAENIGMSVGHVHDRLTEFENKGLVRPPRKPNAARDRTLTELGEQYLETNGYVPMRVFDDV